MTAKQEALRSLFITKYYSGNKIEKNEMSVACSTYGGEELCIRGSGGVTLVKETTWKT